MWADDDEPWGSPAETLAAPVDPWAGSATGLGDDVTRDLGADVLNQTLANDVPQTLALARSAAGNGRLFGVVYCCRTATDRRKYVGESGPRKDPKTGRTVQCSPGRRVDEHRAKKTWGSEILPGRAGYEVLEWTTASGRGHEYDKAYLRYRQDVWIQRLNPTENDLRPVPRHPDLVQRRPVPAPAAPSVRPRRARRSFAWFRVLSFAFWCVLYASGFGWLFTLTEREAPWVPWVLVPSLALACAWWSLATVWRFWDRLTRPSARPPAKARRARR
jgi:hypothetical protein